VSETVVVATRVGELKSRRVGELGSWRVEELGSWGVGGSEEIPLEKTVVDTIEWFVTLGAVHK
jgi:hypothetical protein